MNSKDKIREIIKRLKEIYPNPKVELIYSTPFELLVATILSAQTTDKHINKITKKIFEKYKSMKDYANAPIEDLQNDLNSINFYKNKSSNIQKCAKIIIEQFDSEIPMTMEELTTLPGIARKTANIILSTIYSINAGIAVDTHVKRLSQRLGLSKYSDPVRIEKDLMSITPKKEWAAISYLLIAHGRSICKSKNPNHQECILIDLCPEMTKIIT